MRRALLPLVLVSLAACSRADPVAETAERLGEIRSGHLHLRLVAAAADDAETGFELRGPFSLPDREGRLPIAQMNYTTIAGERRQSFAFVSDGRTARAGTEGDLRPLPSDRIEGLRGLSGHMRASPLEQLRIEDWLIDPRLSEGEDVAGAATEKVSGRLDIVAVVRDLSALAQALGTPVPLRGLAEQDEERLRRSARETRFEMQTGERDRLLRTLRLDIVLAATGAPEVVEALGPLAGARLAFDLRIERPNEPVPVPSL